MFKAVLASLDSRVRSVKAVREKITEKADVNVECLTGFFSFYLDAYIAPAKI